LSYTLQKLNEAEAREIASWRYEEPYSFYNLDDSIVEEYVAYLLDPRFAYHAVYEGDLLVGFCCFGQDAQVPGGDYSLPDTLDIGVGMRPELTGQGRGSAFLATILDYARRYYDASQFRATIATFNQRSQRLFAQAGFQPVQRFVSILIPTTEFVVMVKHP
jgi:RimJ/RimL family protein N-acetyltransferase